MHQTQNSKLPIPQHFRDGLWDITVSWDKKGRSDLEIQAKLHGVNVRILCRETTHRRREAITYTIVTQNGLIICPAHTIHLDNPHPESTSVVGLAAAYAEHLKRRVESGELYFPAQYPVNSSF